MVDPNKLRITRNDQGTEVLASDAQGQVHDISAKFREIRGSTTPAGFQNTFRAQDDGTVVEVEFTAVDKVLEYTLTEQAAKQICALDT